MRCPTILTAILLIFVIAIPAALAETFEYLGSTLWTGINDVAISGNYAYCAYYMGFVVLDISDRTNPVLISKIPIGNVNRVKLHNDYAFAAGYGMDLKIIDISNPRQPFIAATCETGGTCGDVCFKDSLAFAAGINYGLYIVDIARPTQPQTIGTYANIGVNICITRSGDYVYMGDGWDYIDVINIANPIAPVGILTYDLSAIPRNIAIVDTIAYVAADAEGLIALNIANPANLFEIDHFDPIATIKNVAIQSNFAFISWEWNGLTVLDISNPANMREYSHFRTKSDIYSIKIYSDTAYISEGSNLEILNIEHPLWISRIGSFENTNGIYNIEKYGDYIAACDGVRLWLLDKSIPSDPHPISKADLQYSSKLISAYQHYAILMGETGYYTVVDLQNPEHPVVLQNILMPYEFNSMAIWDHYAFLGTFDGVQMLDIADPVNPVQMGLINNGSYNEVYAENGLLVGGCYQLYIVSLADPGNPMPISEMDLSDRYIRNIDIDGDYIYLTLMEEQVDNPGVLNSISIEDIYQPHSVGTFTTREYMDNLAVGENLALVCNNGDGLRLISISEQVNPWLIETYYTPGYARDVIVEDSLAYLADGISVSILKYEPPCVYIAGDLNSSGWFDGTDVIFGVNYFKGGMEPPYQCRCQGHGEIFAEGDVNNSCTFNGLDVTYMVKYLKGGPELLQCRDCQSLPPPMR
jgi:hypothetical protein